MPSETNVERNRMLPPQDMSTTTTPRIAYDKDIAIIREVYDNENSHEAFGEELERALEIGLPFIVIEPSRLGDETARWIAVGNCLHKTAIITGLGSVICGLVWSEQPFMYAPLGITSLFCTGLYTVSWQFDPCVKYQVWTDPQTWLTHTLPNFIASASPVILIRKNDTRRKILHSCVTMVSTIFCAWKVYKIFNN